MSSPSFYQATLTADIKLSDAGQQAGKRRWWWLMTGVAASIREAFLPRVDVLMLSKLVWRGDALHPFKKQQTLLSTRNLSQKLPPNCIPHSPSN